MAITNRNTHLDADQVLSMRDLEGHMVAWTATRGWQLDSSDNAGGVTNKNGERATATGSFITIDGNPHLLKGHTQAIIDLAWSPDQQYVVSQGADGKIGLWHKDGAMPLALLQLTDGTVRNIVWTQDGSAVYIPGLSGKIVFDVAGKASQIEAADVDYVFSSQDVLTYRLDELLLGDVATIERLKMHATGNLAAALSEYLLERAKAQPDAAQRTADEALARALGQ
ncbi:MAG: WD40 repeat domain-containing protein [Saprospiraceae bacterium]